MSSLTDTGQSIPPEMPLDDLHQMEDEEKVEILVPDNEKKTKYIRKAKKRAMKRQENYARSLWYTPPRLPETSEPDVKYLHVSVMGT